MSQKIVFTLPNSEDPDDMPLYAAFHLGLHCSQKYLFTSTQIEIGLTKITVKTQDEQVDLSTDT